MKIFFFFFEVSFEKSITRTNIDIRTDLIIACYVILLVNDVLKYMNIPLIPSLALAREWYPVLQDISLIATGFYLSSVAVDFR